MAETSPGDKDSSSTMNSTYSTMDSKRVILITGGTSGIGFECCKALLERSDLHVMLVGSTQQSVDNALSKLKPSKSTSDTQSTIQGFACDLSQLASVRSLVNELISSKMKLSTIICNAAVEGPLHPMTEDGFETTFATNHLGHFLLTTALFHAGVFAQPTSSTKSRLIVVSSSLYNSRRTPDNGPDVSKWKRVAFGVQPESDATWTSRQAYATSKLCNVLFAHEFQRRYGDQVDMYIFSPGFVPDTNLFRNHSAIGWFFAKNLIKAVSYCNAVAKMSTPKRSGDVLAKLGGDVDVQYKSGSFIWLDELHEASDKSKDPRIAKQLWELSSHWCDQSGSSRSE